MVGWMAWGMAAAAQQQGCRKGPWPPEEDKLLADYVSQNGEGRWSSVSRCAGLNRSGKSCRLRWVNYLRPGLKRCQITPQEEGIIIELHALWGNKWSTIARYLPGRTDNEIKNYWRTHFKKRDRLTSHNTKSRKLRNQKHIHQPTNEIMLTPQQGEVVPLGETKLNTTKADEDKVIISANYVDMEDCHSGRLMSYPANEDVTTQDDFLWSGSLWSFNDPQGAHSTTPPHQPETQEQLCSKVPNLQNQATLSDFNGYPWGSGDYANYYTLLYNEGYSFLLS